MPAGKGPLRFRRTGYNQAGNYSSKPRWHRSAREIEKHEYKQLVAICGYTTPASIAMFLGYDLSRARVPSNGELCLKCEKIAEEEAKYAALHPKKDPKKKEGTNEV